jgi:hypothetical protein
VHLTADQKTGVCAYALNYFGATASSFLSSAPYLEPMTYADLVEDWKPGNTLVTHKLALADATAVVNSAACDG